MTGLTNGRAALLQSGSILSLAKSNILSHAINRTTTIRIDFISLQQNISKQDDEDDRIPPHLNCTPLTAWNYCADLKTTTLVLLPFVVATGSAAREHGDETFVKYQCMFDNESRRRHEIDLPESFLKEHQRILMQNPSFASRRCYHERLRSRSRKRHHGARRDSPLPPIGS
jgi:hypothetical protein